MRQENFRDAVVTAKYKIFAALAIVVVTKYESCIRPYTKMVYQAGITQEEVLKYLNVAMTNSTAPENERL